MQRRENERAKMDLTWDKNILRHSHPQTLTPIIMKGFEKHSRIKSNKIKMAFQQRHVTMQVIVCWVMLLL